MGCSHCHGDISNCTDIKEFMVLLDKELVELNSNMNTLTLKSKDIYEVGKKVYSINSAILSILKGIKRLDSLNFWEKIKENSAYTFHYYYNCHSYLLHDQNESDELNKFNKAEIELKLIKNDLNIIVKNNND